MRLGGFTLVLLGSCTGDRTLDRAAIPTPTAPSARPATPTRIALPAQLAGPSEVLIEFLDAWGGRIAPGRCELLMYVWNGIEVVPLQTEGFWLRLPLDVGWATSRYAGADNHLGAAFLLLTVPGHAPVLSNPFKWIGHSGQDLVTELSFPDGTRVSVHPGETRKVTLRFREPVRRVLHLISREGEPVADAKVTTRLYWTVENHCGVMITRELARGRSDAEGRIEVPDGDWRIGFRIEAPGWLLESPRSTGYPMEGVVRPVDRETPIYLRRKVVQPLRLLVTELGRPAGGLTLLANLADRACGATSGLFATTDDQGRLEREVFYPGDYDRLWFEDDRGQVRWQADPRQMDLSEVVRIDLRE